VGFDRVALIVDPAVRTRLFDHGGEILLPTGILLEAGPLAQRSLENPGRLCIGEFRLAATARRTASSRPRSLSTTSLKARKFCRSSNCNSPAAVNFRNMIPPLEHDPEKWKPVFRKDHAQTKS